MGTNGTITIKSQGQTLTSYNHFDSDPSYLGVEVAKLIQSTNAEEVATLIAAARKVDESEKADAADLLHLKAAGIWQDVSSGDDWYAALRGLQGDILGMLRLGYAMPWKWGDNQEWGYLADFDHETLSITYSGDNVGVYPFATLADLDMSKVEALAYH